MENKPVVTITGVSGYLGSHVCLYFLKSGEFKVRGTVRSKTNAKKIEPLKKAFGRYFDELELVEADLLDRQSLIRAVQGAEFVVHTASPFPTVIPKDINLLLKPAVDGSLAVLEACRSNKVKRCVITSSTVTVMNTKEPLPRYDETIWSEPNLGNFYMQSKTRAEMAAWDYMSKLPADEKFELTTVLPGYIIGPTLIKTDFTSGEFIKLVMLGKLPGCPKVEAASIDVRDCAEAHFKALTVPEAAGERFVMVDAHPWFTEIGLILHEKYGKDYPVTKGEMSKCLAWAGSFFSGEMEIMYGMWNKSRPLDNTKAKRVLGMKFTDVKKSFWDMADSMIDLGLITDKRK